MHHQTTFKKGGLSSVLFHGVSQPRSDIEHPHKRVWYLLAGNIADLICQSVTKYYKGKQFISLLALASILYQNGVYPRGKMHINMKIYIRFVSQVEAPHIQVYICILFQDALLKIKKTILVPNMVLRFLPNGESPDSLCS